MTAGMANETLIPVLEDVGRQACDLAAEKAGRQLKTLSGGRAAFYPKIDVQGMRVGVGVIERYHYLVYQDTGFACFPMNWAIGRTIPIHLPDGSVVFRYCGDVGSPRGGIQRYWYYGADGRLVSRNEIKRSWTHPGLPPKYFLRDAANEAVRRNRPDIARAARVDRIEAKAREFEKRGGAWGIAASATRSFGQVVRSGISLLRSRR
jgi:hypothetical protein